MYRGNIFQYPAQAGRGLAALILEIYIDIARDRDKETALYSVELLLARNKKPGGEG